MYRQAILDAKAVRASAIANAKASLQEAFEPKIQEMLRLKLSEELEEELEEEVEEGINDPREPLSGYQDTSVAENEEIEESELDEILAELESLSEETEEEGKMEERKKKMEEAEEMEEGYEEMEEGYEEMEEGEDLEEDYEEMEEAEEEAEEEDGEDDGEEGEGEVEGDEEPTDDTKVVELTLGDLKAALADLMPQMGGEPDGDEGHMSGEEPTDLSLDEILAGLQEDNESIEEAKGDESKSNFQDLGHGYGKQKTYTKSVPKAKPGQMGKTTPKAPKIGHGYGGSNISEPFVKSSSTPKGFGGKDHTPYSTDVQTKKSGALAEANKTIKALTSQLNEINLLNAKLLYMNRIFKSKSLNESQKVKVVTAFDKAASVKEVKNVYEILKESISTAKAPLKESFGFASKPMGVAPKKGIVDTDPTAARWQQLVFGNK